MKTLWILLLLYAEYSASTKELSIDTKLTRVKWRGTLIIKVRCCGTQSCSDEDYYDNEDGGNATESKVSSAGKKVKGGANSKKFFMNGRKPGKGKNKVPPGKGKGQTRNKNGSGGKPSGSGGSRSRGGSGSKDDSDSGGSDPALAGGSGLGNSGGAGAAGSGILDFNGKSSIVVSEGDTGSAGPGSADPASSGASGGTGSGALGGAAGDGKAGAGTAGGTGAASGTGDPAIGTGTSGDGTAVSGAAGSGTSGGGADGSGGAGTGTAGNGSGGVGSGAEGTGISGSGAEGSGTAGSGSAGTGTAGSGTGTAGSGASGTGTAGSGASGTGTAGSGAAGTGTAGSGAAGTGTAGSGAAGTGTAGSGAAGTGTAGSGTAGTWTAGSGTAGTGTTGSGAAGTGTAGSGTAGTGTAGNGAAGTGTAGSGTAGTGTAGSGAAGTGTAGTGTAGSGTAGTGTAGSGAASTGVAGNGTAGAGTAESGAAGAGNGTGTAGSGTAGSGAAGTGTAGSGAVGNGTAPGGSDPATTASTTTVSTTTTTTAGPTKLTKPPCPVHCVKNASWFDSAGAVKTPHVHGVWMEKCGRLYMLGNYLGRYDNAWDYCCSLGMTPLMFETLAEQTCFGSMANKSWPYNYNYWTSAKGIPGNYTWCPGAGETPIKPDNLWEQGQPDFKWKNQFCVHVRIYKNISKAMLTDRNCTDWFIIACEGPPTPAPPTVKPKCPPQSCSKDTALFDSSDNLKISKGMWGSFWTSGTDQQYEGEFVWCGSNSTFNTSQVAWKTDQPDNAGGNDNCVASIIANSSILVEDGKCDATYQYACEVRSSVKAPGSAMQDECGAYWSLTQAEIDSILNGTNRKYNVKCFMKCMGENMEIFKDGTLIEDTTYKLIETVSQDDELQLQRDTETYFDCRTRRGEDECGTAEAIYDCGQQSTVSSSSLAKMVVAVETNSTAGKSPVPCVQPDCGAPCSPDPVKENYLVTNTVPIFDGLLKNICGKQYLFSALPLPWAMAKSFCCSYGMQLIAIESAAEKSCVGSAAPPANYWSGGISSGCPAFGFQWCYVNEPVQSALTPNIPFSIGIMPCYMMQIGGGIIMVGDFVCLTPNPFICEKY